MQAILLTGYFCLPFSAIRGKSLKKIWFEKTAQDYDMLRIFKCPTYYHVKEDKLDPRANNTVFLGFKRV